MIMFSLKNYVKSIFVENGKLLEMEGRTWRF